MLFSQVKLNGVVNDSIGSPLQMANVIAVNQKTKTIESFKITNPKGEYSLNLAENTTYQITVSYIGKKNIQIEISTNATDIIRNFHLLEDSTDLDEVELTYKIPIKIKGDTLIYNADSFKNESDKKLEDVLKRLPGVEVTKDGEIKVQGKVVNTIMVEGKRFFDGNTKLATKNIPANVLDKIEILKNHDNVAQLSQLRDNSENVAINIKLKEGKKNFWFGDVMIGGGPSERYIIHPKLFYYSPKKSVNIITDFNNIGDAPLSSNDLSRFSGRFNDVHQKSGTLFNVESTDYGSLALRNNQAKSIDSKFIATDLNYSPSQNWDLSGFAIFSSNITQTIEKSLRQFTQTETNANQIEDETTTNDKRQKSKLGLFKLSSVYKPDSKEQLNYNAFASFSKKSTYKDFYSSVLKDIDETNKQNPYKITQGLDYYYTLNDKNILAFESQYLIQKEDPFYNAILAQTSLFPFADNLGLDQAQSNYNVNQKHLVKTNKFDAKLDYWYVLTKRSNLNFTLGTLLSKQQFNSEIFQILDNGTVNNLTDAEAPIKNDVSYRFNDIYLGLRYRLKTGIFTISPGFTLHNYVSKNTQFENSSRHNFFQFLPNFNTIVKFNNSESIYFNYKIQTRFTDVNKLAEGLVLNNYNSLFRGNRDLENSLSHDLNLSYYVDRNLFKSGQYMSLFTSINYNKAINAFRNKINPDGVLQLSSPFNSNFSDENLSVNLQMARYFWELKAEIGSSISYSKYNQVFEEVVTLNEAITQSYNFALSTSHNKNKPNIEIGYNLIINEYNQGDSNSKFNTDRLFMNFDANFLKAFIFKLDYSYYNYKNQTQHLNSYSFLNANLAYQKKDSQWEYKISATNIFNTKSINQDRTNEFYTSSSQYFIQPRYLVLSLTYNL
ncbi:TonB-dependent receptor [Aureibaculum luteum]|uniref:TonB-dependent receptor n=1 Tax=Aureibaculum luteum TaxID=1548456 RepID=UPI001E5C9E55|nr:TonB-dependent receptor [Aureibaculum luteum]